ncbi:hypothetical protein CBR_g34558 [Chara braunii]|uniref:PHD finger protein ING n=1 Tax=Chara braunii TaxID=69332 RepID=A0A388LIX2_CHABU|nr:hypothetical protein CBR_g34558 [Chara braunii]|eukprot:GBG82274.1 hypothetical protein CBR_g34558 [Chara braunii]
MTWKSLTAMNVITAIVDGVEYRVAMTIVVRFDGVVEADDDLVLNSDSENSKSVLNNEVEFEEDDGDQVSSATRKDEEEQGWSNRRGKEEEEKDSGAGKEEDEGTVKFQIVFNCDVDESDDESCVEGDDDGETECSCYCDGDQDFDDECDHDNDNDPDDDSDSGCDDDCEYDYCSVHNRHDDDDDDNDDDEEDDDNDGNNVDDGEGCGGDAVGDHGEGGTGAAVACAHDPGCNDGTVHLIDVADSEADCGESDVRHCIHNRDADDCRHICEADRLDDDGCDCDNDDDDDDGNRSLREVIGDLLHEIDGDDQAGDDGGSAANNSSSSNHEFDDGDDDRGAVHDSDLRASNDGKTDIGVGDRDDGRREGSCPFVEVAGDLLHELDEAIARAMIGGNDSGEDDTHLKELQRAIYVSSLPAELRRLLSTMRELDERSQAILIQLREQCRQCLNMPSQQSKKATPEQVEAIDKLRREIEDNQEKSLSLSMEKVLLAKQANEMVETHVKRLDEDLANFEEELKQGPSFHSRRHHDEGKLPLDSPMVLLSGDKRKGDFRAPPFKRPDMRGDREREREMDMDQALGAHRRKVQVEVEADQPVDPDEPKYCVCHQVSFGEMIACDNEDCKGGEWFHYGCVGLSPENRYKGRWYCPECKQQLQMQRRGLVDPPI